MHGKRNLQVKQFPQGLFDSLKVGFGQAPAKLADVPFVKGRDALNIHGRSFRQEFRFPDVNLSELSANLRSERRDDRKRPRRILVRVIEHERGAEA